MKKEMEQTVSGKQLFDQLEAYEKHGIRLLQRLVLILFVTTILLNPQSATIFMMEYFKIDPSLALNLIESCFPLITAIVIARVVCVLWVFGGRYVFTALVMIFLLPAIYIGKLLRLKYVNKILEWLKYKDRETKARYLKSSETGIEREIKYINIAVAILITLSLEVALPFNNPIGQLWNPKLNKKLFITTNAHYYCQITGTYNDDQCKKWKAELTDYNRKVSTPISDRQ